MTIAVQNAGTTLPIVFFDRQKLSTGFGCFPKEERSVEVNGVNISRNVMTRSLSAALGNLTANSYTIVPLDLEISAGSKLTATNNGGIRIGTNTSKVLVSGMVSYAQVQSTANRHIKIIKNSYTTNNTLAQAMQLLSRGQAGNILIPPILANVQEGDIIYIFYYTENTTDEIRGGTYGSSTSLTVETVE